MALTNIISFGIKDASGKRKTLPIWVPAAATLTEINAFVTAGAPLLDALIDGQIIDAVVALSLTLPSGLKSAPVNGNRVREGALLSISATSTVYLFDSYVPSVSNSHFNGDLLNLSDAAVTDWYTQMTGPGVGQPDPTDTDGNDLVAVERGVRTFRK
jgi:hypothetical protein